MKALIQRVKHAEVKIDGRVVTGVDKGMLAFIGVEKKDSSADIKKLVRRLLDFRIFPDKTGKMNLSVRDINGGILLVPQFTIVAETNRGNRPSFSLAAEPKCALALFNSLVEQACREHTKVTSGRFGADMDILLVNDGPATFCLDTLPKCRG